MEAWKHSRINMCRLEQLAEQDASYQVWKQAYTEAEAAFEAYANAQPEAIRNVLYGYAEAGRLMNQRLVNLACTHMSFPADKKE